MAAGIILTSTDINNAIGSISRQIETILGIQVPLLYTALQQIGSIGLQGTQFNFSPTDASLIMQSIGDLEKLNQVFVGNYIVTAGGSPGSGVPGVGNGYDFRTNIKQLWGLPY